MTSPAPRLITAMWVGAAAVWLGLLMVPLARAWILAPDLGHGWSAPILMGYLWWERWLDCPDRPTGSVTFHPLHLCAIIPLVILIIPLRFALTPFPLWPSALWLYAGLMAVLALYGSWLRAGRPGVQGVGAPLLLIIGVVPWPGVFERTLILPLREGIAQVVAESSNLLGAPALAVGTSVHLATGWVGIDEACGGIRSLHACVTAALFLGVWWRFGLKQKLGLVGIAFCSAVTGNLLRVGFLTWSAGQPNGSIERWHDPAGMAALAFSLLLTGWVGWRWHQSDQPVSPTAVSPTEITHGAVAPSSRAAFVAVGLTALLGSIEVSVRWHFHSASPGPFDGSDWTASLPLKNPTFRTEILSDEAYELLKPDYFVSGHWRTPDNTLYAANYVEWKRGQVARSAPFAHNPTICLPFAGFALVQELDVIEIPWSGATIPFRCYIFRRMNQELVVAFTIWDPERRESLMAPESQEGWLAWIKNQWREVREGRENQPAQLLALGILGQENAHLLPAALAKLITSPAHVPATAHAFLPVL